MKRYLALLLAIVLTVGLAPTFASAQGGEEDIVPYEIRHPQTTEIWKTIEQTEDKYLTEKSVDFAAAAQEAYALVEASDATVPGSLERHGDAFFWKTTDGAMCGYNPVFRERVRKSQTGALTEIRDSEPVETVSGTLTTGRNVAVIQPYIGIDRNFSVQYANEGKSIAEALGGSCSVYKTTDATIDNIAKALASCAVVIFDSHGSTDYEAGDDCVSKANTSYLCLQTDRGITAADQAYVQGKYGRYPHAFYGGSNGAMKFYMVDGTAIANHMTGTAPDSLLWMAICLGMATDGMHAPLRKKGVQTVYGYSQSVTFGGDYQYEESFFYAMKQGATVASAISMMKRELGNWDPVYKSYSEMTALRNYVAFPIVVSDEDVYPGKGKVDAVQTVAGKGCLKETEFLYGDVNGDGRVGITDVSLLLRYSVKSASLTRDQLLRADVNADCGVNANDAAELLRHVAKLIGKFPVEP